MNYYDVQILPRIGVCMANDPASIIVESQLFRNHSEGTPVLQQISLPFEPAESRQSIPGGFYAGFLISHYGHFLLESLSRLYALERSGHTRIIWNPIGGRGNTFTRWQLEIFKLLGLDKCEHVVLNSPTHAACLYISPPGYRIKDIFEVEHANFLGVVQAPENGRRLWISRRSGRRGVGWSNEDEVEAALAQLGWEIINPVEHSITDQVRMLAGARVVAGTVGSAFHTLLLAKEVKSKVVLFSLGPSMINRNFLTIWKRKGFSQEVHFPSQRAVETGEVVGAKFEVKVAEVLAPLAAFNRRDRMVFMLKRRLKRYWNSAR